MKTQLLTEEQLVKKATDVLYQKLGPVEATRFFSLPREKRTESVKRHREWQKNLDVDEFLGKLFKDEVE